MNDITLPTAMKLRPNGYNMDPRMGVSHPQLATNPPTEGIATLIALLGIADLEMDLRLRLLCIIPKTLKLSRIADVAISVSTIYIGTVVMNIP